MKITLVSPFSDVSGTGIRTISACLKQNGHEVRLIFLPKDFRIRYDRQTLDQAVALAKGSDLIGITLMTNFFQNTIQLTRKFREETGIPVLWGGIHPTVRPEECLDHTEMICLGEGEETVVELAEKMEKGQDYRHIPGMWFKDRKKIIRNSMRPLIQDLNSLPFQDYGFENNYILSGGRIQEMTGPILNMHLAGDYMAFPTRGCPFGCAYCCNNTINNLYPGQKPLRKRSVKHIIGELT
ncbi:MAG: B12-binding domain-containing radical SAM protein, partial [bacterium]